MAIGLTFQQAKSCARRVSLLLALGFGLAGTITDAEEQVIADATVLIGNGNMFERASIRIRDRRIVEVSENLQPEPGSSIFDAEGYTVMPGLIDTHADVLLLNDQGADSENPFSERLAEIIESGVTTVYIPGDGYPDIREAADSVRDGQISGPRILFAGPVFTAPGGHPECTVCRYKPICKEKATRVLDSVEQVALNQVLDSERVLKMMTLDAAKYLELEKELGSLEPGKWADLVVLDGDPQEDLSNLAKVIAIFRSDDLHVDRRSTLDQAF